MYLRRNQEDVLAELPDLIRTDEWVEFGRYDYAAYRDAVVQGNFMAMRRAADAAYAAYGEGMAAQCAKLGRLLELIAEAAANGRKVVVFSFFREVLDTVWLALGRQAYGPLTGAMSPSSMAMPCSSARSRPAGSGSTSKPPPL